MLKNVCVLCLIMILQCIIVPNHEWGGNGSLGCDVGYGLLHRIPRRKKETDNNDNEQNNNNNTEQQNTTTYSDTIFSSPDEVVPDHLEEARQTLLPPSPSTQQD